MTDVTKLNKKLYYLKETVDEIRTALNNRGLEILETDTLRSIPAKIEDGDFGGSEKEYVPSDGSFEAGEKALAVSHGKMVPIKNSLMGTFQSIYLQTISNNDACLVEDTVFCGGRPCYLYNKEDETLTCIFDYDTNFSHQLITHPFIEGMYGSHYIKKTGDTFEYIELSYPSGGAGSSYSLTNCLWDGTGKYLINRVSSSVIDILKLVHDEETNTYSYEMYMGNVSIPSASQTGPIHAEADSFSGTTFSVNGRLICYIDERTNTLKTFDFYDVFSNLPISNSSTRTGQAILCYGKNYMVSYYKSSPTVYFIKATPIDATLAESEEGFYVNPDNYTYEIIDSSYYAGGNYSGWSIYPIRRTKTGMFTTAYNLRTFYIKPLKEKIDSMADFDCYIKLNYYPNYGLFLNDNLFLEISQDSNKHRHLIYKREARGVFEPENPPVIAPASMVTETGYGILLTSTSTTAHYVYPMKEGRFTYGSGSSMSVKTFKSPCFMKNGFAIATLDDGWMRAYTFHKKETSTSRSGDSYMTQYTHFVNDDYVVCPVFNKLFYLNDNGDFVSLSPRENQINDITLSSGKSTIMEFYGRLLHMTLSNGLLSYREITPSFEDNTYYQSGLSATVGTSLPYLAILSLAQKVKGAEFYLTKSGFFSCFIYDGHEHFDMHDFPLEVKNAINEASVSYIQTLYTGEVVLILSDWRTILFTPVWDEEVRTIVVKEGTTVQIFDGIEISNNKKVAVYFSPFGAYKIYGMYGDTSFAYGIEVYRENRILTKHLEKNVESNWCNEMDTCFLTGKTKNEGGVFLNEVEYRGTK